MPVVTKLLKVVRYFKDLPSIKLRGSLRSRVTNLAKLSKMVTSGRSFRTQTLKFSRSSFSSFLFFVVAAFRRTDKICLCNFLLFLLQVRMTNIGLIKMLSRVPLSHVIQTEIKNNDRFKQEHVKPCFSTSKNVKSPLPHSLWQPNLSHNPLRSLDKLKTLYLHYQSVNDYKTCKMVSYIERLLPIELLNPLVAWSFSIT